MTFSLPERIALLVAIAASAGFFARDLGARIRRIRAGAADRPRRDRIGLRLRRVVSEVLFQSRVVSGRPIAGLAHAVVFLGFVFFGLETADHFLKGLGLSLLKPVLGPALPYFKGFLALVAVAVAAAIAGLALRRFVFVRYSPDPKSWTSAVVAVFILLLMVTYLNTLRAEPIFERANWWLHSALILVFPHLILRSKHFHIVMAPVAIWFRTHRLGDFLPLDLSEERLAAEEGVVLGLESMAAVPWKMRMDFLSCVECRRCTDQCPANQAGQELDPRGFVLKGRKSLMELADDAAVMGNIFSDRALGQCTSCGACEAICPVGIEHLQLLLGAKRAQALAIGKGVVASDFFQKVERYGNPFSAQAAVRKQLVAELGMPSFKAGESEWLLWLGCVWAYNHDARSAAAAMAQVLARAGVRYGVLDDEACCGHHSRRQGEEMQFQMLARQGLEQLQSAGVKKIVTPCPHCFHTLRREFPTLEPGFAPEVVHHSELIAQLVAGGQLPLERKAGKAETATYHDPCYLGRYEGIFEPPRSLLAAAGLATTELPRRRERSYCCGGGSAGFAREQEEARRVDQVRKEEIAASGAQLLVTSCPECKMMLTAAVDRTLDVAELVAERLASPAPARTGG